MHSMFGVQNLSEDLSVCIHDGQNICDEIVPENSRTFGIGPSDKIVRLWNIFCM